MIITQQRRKENTTTTGISNIADLASLGHGGSGKILGTHVRLVLVEQSHDNRFRWGLGAWELGEESRNRSHASLSINIINNTLNNYMVLINNVYINRYLNVEHTTNKIVRIRVKMGFILLNNVSP